MPADELLTIAQVAEHLGITYRTATRWIAEGRIPAVRIGPRTRRIKRSELDKFIRSD